MSLKEIYFDQRFISTETEIPPLPFFHCCEAVHLQGIIDNGKLEPRPCNVFNEKLLYLFYGRPAYRSSELSNSRLSFMMPVCFIIRPDAIKKIKRAVAFDSGAFEYYAEYLHPSMKLEQFHLTPIKATLNKMVNFFFDDNKSYFEGQAKKEIDFDPAHFQVEGYHSIITSVHKTNVDDRKATLEIQLDYTITLCNDNIEAILLPKNLALSEIIKSKISRNLGIEMIPIRNYGVAAKEYYVHMLEETRAFLLKRQYLNGC